MVAVDQAPLKVLFSCTFNAVRSPMAAALLSHLAGRRLEVSSAGVFCGTCDPFVAAVMEEMGIDMTAHEPRSFNDLGFETFDTIITLSPEAHHHAVELTRVMAADVEYWPTFDPSVIDPAIPPAHRLTAYRRVRDVLLEHIKQRFAIEGGPSV